MALEGHPRTSSTLDGWEHVLADHRGLLEPLHDDASCVARRGRLPAAADRPVRLLVLTDASTPAGRSRAQSIGAVGSGRRSRPRRGASPRLTAGLESGAEAATRTATELAALLLRHPDLAALAGAELAIHDDWLGLRSHPRPIGAVTYGGPAIPSWLDASLREIVGATGPDR